MNKTNEWDEILESVEPITFMGSEFLIREGYSHIAADGYGSVAIYEGHPIYHALSHQWIPAKGKRVYHVGYLPRELSYLAVDTCKEISQLRNSDG